jgi:hypothetical protein
MTYRIICEVFLEGTEGLASKHQRSKTLYFTSCNTAAEWSGPKALDLIFCHLHTISSANFASILGISIGSSCTTVSSINNNLN